MIFLTASIPSDARIDAEVEVVQGEDNLAAIRQVIGPSAVLFAGFQPDDSDVDGRMIPYLDQVFSLPGDVVLVYNAGDAVLDA